MKKMNEVSLLLGTLTSDEVLPPKWRCGIDSREAWVVLTVVVLFTGSFIAPFVLDTLHAVSTTMIDDPELGVTAGDLANIGSIELFVSCISLLFAHSILHRAGARGTYLLVLSSLALFSFLIAIIRSETAFAICWCFIGLMFSLSNPTSGFIVAGWVDGHLLGRAFGVISVASKISPSVVYSVYGALLHSSAVNAWQSCFLVGGCLILGMFAFAFAFLRNSAVSLGFRHPTPPGHKKGDPHLCKIQHPMAHESSVEMLRVFLCSPRSLMLLISMALLVCLKGSTSFVTIYASKTLNATHSDGNGLLLIYSLSR